MIRFVNSLEKRYQRECIHDNYRLCHRKIYCVYYHKRWTNKSVIDTCTYNTSTCQSLIKITNYINVDLMAKYNIYDIFLKRYYLCSAQKD